MVKLKQFNGWTLIGEFKDLSRRQKRMLRKYITLNLLRKDLKRQMEKTRDLFLKNFNETNQCKDESPTKTKINMPIHIIDLENNYDILIMWDYKNNRYKYISINSIRSEKFKDFISEINKWNSSYVENILVRM